MKFLSVLCDKIRERKTEYVHFWTCHKWNEFLDNLIFCCKVNPKDYEIEFIEELKYRWSIFDKVKKYYKETFTYLLENNQKVKEVVIKSALNYIAENLNEFKDIEFIKDLEKKLFDFGKIINLNDKNK